MLLSVFELFFFLYFSFIIHLFFMVSLPYLLSAIVGKHRWVPASLSWAHQGSTTGVWELVSPLDLYLVSTRNGLCLKGDRKAWPPFIPKGRSQPNENPREPCRAWMRWAMRRTPSSEREHTYSFNDSFGILHSAARASYQQL